MGLSDPAEFLTDRLVSYPGQFGAEDLIRVCAEIREELEPQEQTLEVANALSAPEAESAPHPARRVAGAIYVSCAGRGGPHFGAPSAERRAPSCKSCGAPWAMCHWSVFLQAVKLPAIICMAIPVY